VHQVGKKCIVLCYIYIYIGLFILTFMAVLLGDRSTQDSSGRKIAGVARGEMYTNTKTDDHLSGDGSKHLN